MSQAQNSSVSRKAVAIPSRIVGYRIQKVFEQNGNQWETIQGVSESANLSCDLVERHILRHPSLYKKSPITIGGIPIFALQEFTESQEGHAGKTNPIHISNGPTVVQQTRKREPFRGNVIITNVPKKRAPIR